MTVTSVEKDPREMTMTITVVVEASIDSAWQLWQDPRKLERWWGPPTYPATFVDHDLSPGALVRYYMTGPAGDRPRGWWRVLTVDAPAHLSFENGLADDAGEPDPAMPTMLIDVDLHERGIGTTMTITTTFPSTQAMEQVLAMGMEEGMVTAIGQIESIPGVVAGR